MSQLHLEGTPEAEDQEEARAARAGWALWLRDCRRSVGQANAKRYWPRVRKEYTAAGRVALAAADGEETDERQ